MPANRAAGSPVRKPTTGLSPEGLQRSNGHCATPRKGKLSHDVMGCLISYACNTCLRLAGSRCRKSTAGNRRRGSSRTLGGKSLGGPCGQERVALSETRTRRTQISYSSSLLRPILVRIYVHSRARNEARYKLRICSSTLVPTSGAARGKLNGGKVPFHTTTLKGETI